MRHSFVSQSGLLSLFVYCSGFGDRVRRFFTVTVTVAVPASVFTVAGAAVSGDVDGTGAGGSRAGVTETGGVGRAGSA